jgi:L-alanine-DL-glutamate epimerase-like enolase superfamily enzyme
MPVILDETVFTAHDLMRVIQEDLGHGVNIKIAKSGISESLNIFSMAKAHNLRLMIGCMTETMTGLSAGIYFALGTGGFDYIDLDAIHFLHHKNRYGDIHVEGPRYTLAHSS